ncbi:MAG TPA: hypothetical protein VK866_08920 [Acidimicrobiales bacterium]|nr:hypothetical protein [Acidimicrobiales bacterium]
MRRRRRRRPGGTGPGDATDGVADAGGSSGGPEAEGTGAEVGATREGQVDAVVAELGRAAVDAGGLRGLVRRGGRLPDAARARGAALVDAVAHRVVRDPLDVRTADEALARIEAARRRSGTGRSVVSYLAGRRLVRRSVAFGSRRVPAVVVVTSATALASSVAAGARELHVLGSQLVHRARAHGVEVSPRLVRVVLVQVYLRPEARPDLARPPRWLTSRLLAAWVRRAAAGVVPFMPDAIAAPRPHDWVRAIDRLDLDELARHVDGTDAGAE